MVAKRQSPTRPESSDPIASMRLTPVAIAAIRDDSIDRHAAHKRRYSASPLCADPAAAHRLRPPPPAHVPIGQKPERLGTRVVEHRGGERAADHRASVEIDAMRAQVGPAALLWGMAVHDE